MIGNIIKSGMILNETSMEIAIYGFIQLRHEFTVNVC